MPKMTERDGRVKYFLLVLHSEGSCVLSSTRLICSMQNLMLNRACRVHKAQTRWTDPLKLCPTPG